VFVRCNIHALRSWYSLTVREETAKRIRELVKAKGLTVDGLINEFMSSFLKGVWLRCSLCGTKVKAENMPKHMARMHPRARK
jgi:hypothetical protein